MNLPRLLIPMDKYQKIMAYVLGCDTEITGFADIAYRENMHAFVVGEIYLLPQTATGADVEMDEDVISAFNLSCVDMGMTTLPRLWWHSHVEMQAFFSGTDAKAMEDLKNDAYSVALVLNKLFDMKATLRQYAPVDLKEDIEVLVIPTVFKPSAEILAEIEAKVTKKEDVVVPTKQFRSIEDAPIVFWQGHLVSGCEKAECQICTDYYSGELPNYDERFAE